MCKRSQIISNEKCAGKVQPTLNEKDENQGAYNWKGVEKNAKQ
jgi:hypothetical protein